ncbi:MULTISPECIES: transposase [unclassified Pseudomonas]|uniref:transposase n=1 Tax=unclassified Pseudomonas TaxID=196821 RepID=UPI000DAC360C
MKRKKYSSEFKQESIKLVRRSGASCRKVALEIDLAPNLLTRRFREAQPVLKRPFPEQLAREMRSWPGSSVGWPR